MSRLCGDRRQPVRVPTRETLLQRASATRPRVCRRDERDRIDITPTEHGLAQAASSWQSRHGLGADGIIGPKTWRKLEPLTRYSVDTPKRNPLPSPAPPSPHVAKRGRLLASEGDVTAGALDVNDAYDLGKFFGAKFQPWGAVKVARAIGVVGRVIGTMASILGVLSQIREDRLREESEIAMRNARNEVRTAYRNAGHAVEDAFRLQVEAFLTEFYGTELGSVDRESAELTESKQERSVKAAKFAELARRAADLIGRVESARLTASDGA